MARIARGAHCARLRFGRATFAARVLHGLRARQAPGGAHSAERERGNAHTMRILRESGGLWVDESMAVCDEEHTPIAGLYAAGNVAGGGMGEPYYHGGSVAWSLVTGKICGEN